MCLTVVLVPPPHTPRRRSLSALAAAGLLGALLPAIGSGVAPGLTPTAQASWSYMCTGYAGCRSAGYSDAGYGAVNSKMYWRMYGGHNCTNYVAYRMIKAGFSSERPWVGSGNASNWGLAMKSKTNQTPTVGAVAWWRSGAAGVSSSGHVAYVEKVVSPTEIIVSEDSWSGDFDWRTIRRDGAWPSGFIHFVDQKTQTNTVAPKITGTPAVGATLSATHGRWKPSGAYRYQWLAGGAAVAGATSATFVPTVEQVDQQLSVRVTSTRTGYGPASALSQPTAAVTQGAIASTAPPVVSGEPKVGQTLSAAGGQWSPNPSFTAFRWKADGRVLREVDGPTLTLDRALSGKSISVTEVARGDGYDQAAADSNAVGPVVEGVIEETRPFRATGEARLGSSLAIQPGTVSPADVAVSYAWLRDGVPITGASEASYSPTADDVGHQVVARVTLSKTGYDPVVRTFVMGEQIVAPSALRINAKGKRRMAVVAVRVDADGASPQGDVTVRVGRKSQTVPVVDGFARVPVKGLAAGSRGVRVKYAGAGAVEGSRATSRVTITR